MMGVKVMVDITMCKADECPLRENCFRYLAKAADYQAYFILKPEEIDKVKQTEKCNEFWPVSSEKEVEKLNQYWRD